MHTKRLLLQLPKLLAFGALGHLENPPVLGPIPGFASRIAKKPALIGWLFGVSALVFWLIKSVR